MPRAFWHRRGAEKQYAEENIGKQLPHNNAFSQPFSSETRYSALFKTEQFQNIEMLYMCTL
jgi:hypothetical protein